MLVLWLGPGLDTLLPPCSGHQAAPTGEPVHGCLWSWLCAWLWKCVLLGAVLVLRWYRCLCSWLCAWLGKCLVLGPGLGLRWCGCLRGLDLRGLGMCWRCVVVRVGFAKDKQWS